MTPSLKRTWQMLQLWVPTAVAAFLVYRLLNETKDPLPTGITSFLIFVPMLFYFVAQVNYNYLRRLEKRIETLETGGRREG
jgi:hypothetical protein